MSDSDYVPDEAEILVEKGSMKLIRSASGSGKEYVLDTGELVFELTDDEMMSLDKLCDEWFFEEYMVEHTTETFRDYHSE